MTDYISPEGLRQEQGADPPPVVVDVRDQDEFSAGHVPGALHIPADELEARLGEIPRDRPVVPY